MLEVSAVLVFMVGVIVGAVLGGIGVCIIALVWKGGDKDGREK